MRIIIDAMGGDNAPGEIVAGALQARKDFGVDIILTGDRAAIEAAMRERNAAQPDTYYSCAPGKSTASLGARSLALPEGVTLRHCTEVVDMCDDPAWACRRKKDSSMTVGLMMLKNGEGDAFISAGSTGALLSGATLLVKRIRGIRRAAMSPLIPTVKGNAVLVDCGANIECTPEYLLQFAYIGSIYARHALRLDRPRVGLLNIGTEESKGMALHRQAYVLLKQAGDAGRINFIGNIEAKDAVKGGADVIVTDGFSGNIMLKTFEGVGSYLKVELKSMFFKNALTKLGALLVKDGVKRIRDSLDPNERGATPFLGISKPVMKAHGSSNARAIRNAVKAAIECVDSRLEQEIAENIVHMQVEEKT